MIELAQAVPDPQVLLALEPEELGGKLLWAMRKNGAAMFHLSHFEGDLFTDRGRTPAYPPHLKTEIQQAILEAWAWLEAQGLLVPADTSNGANGWRRLSRRARRMETEADFATYRTARLLSRDMLHPAMAEPVWLAFMRGEFDAAVFQAMKAVEVAVRHASGLGNEWLGTKLMRKAFAPEDGPLTDMTAEAGERAGRMDLFAGAIASYKNPHSHRDVDLDDPAEATEIILLANHLLRICLGIRFAQAADIRGHLISRYRTHSAIATTAKRMTGTAPFADNSQPPKPLYLALTSQRTSTSRISGRFI
jgi:uncharacterized protein (TIGR02391 family)